MKHYSVYGLTVRSNVELDGVAECDTALDTDIRLQLGSLPAWMSGDATSSIERELWHVEGGADGREPRMRVSRLRRGAYIHLQYADGTEFVLDRAATRIWGSWQDTSSLEDTVCYLLGPVLGLALRLRHVTVLHASVVSFGDRAIAITGHSGAGKSTLAAGLALRGYPILSDDQAVLAETDGGFAVQPGYPRLRLWPNSVAMLFGAGDSLPLLTPTWSKRFLGIDGNRCTFETQPLPLAAVYVLTGRTATETAPHVQAEPAASGLLKLIVNTYSPHLADADGRRLDFERMTRVAQGVPLRSVVAHSDPDRLSELCDAIIRDFQALSGLSADDATTSQASSFHAVC